MRCAFLAFLFSFLLYAAPVAAQPGQPALAPPDLTVEKIMQDPDEWVGAWPSEPFWSENGGTLYFYWNPKGRFTADSLYQVPREGGEPQKVAPRERRRPIPFFDGWHHGEHVYDADFARKVYVHDGDLMLYKSQADTTLRLTSTRTSATDPRFTLDGKAVVYSLEDNLYLHSLESGTTRQLTDLREGEDPEEEDESGAQDAFLEAQQKALFSTLRKQQEEEEEQEAAREADRRADNLPPTFYYGKADVQQLQIDPTERFVTFALVEEPEDEKETSVQDYVTESGYAENLSARSKVGAPGSTFRLHVQDLQRDTTYQVDLSTLPGAYDLLAFLREDREDQGDREDREAAADTRRADSARTDSSGARGLYAFGPYWSPDGSYAVVDVRARDNKDRWIARLDPLTAQLTVLDRQHDDAWIAGPGLSWWGGASTLGWLPGGRRLYFQSEKTGYSHLYTIDAEGEDVRQLTSGDFEVFDPRLSKDGQTWYFTSSEGSPYERHFYRMPVGGGSRTRLTTMAGENQAALSPDGQVMGVLYSYINRPPDVYLQAPQGEPERITTSPTEAWAGYPWREGEILSFTASDSADVPAQLFTPEEPNGAAVLFVHGAGYLQNVHRGWSGYFREYMFHNLLADRGYTVMNVDYRGSAGYGRDWRTAVYRYMGGRDLQDYVDASRYLQEEHGINPERVFIYGGSYGGFITLMALFTEGEHFGGGAALRAVTDWAHY
ncbi:MAG: alpha/beta fold hydrolase, partial [Rhodothermales bacterium]